MKLALLSSKGQITIPKDVQRLLKIGYRSRLALYPQKGVLIVKPLKTSIAVQTAGSLKKYVDPQKLGVPFLKAREETQKIAAAELVKND